MVGVGSGGTLTGLGRFFAQGFAEDRDGAGRPGRLGAGAADQDRASWNEAGSWTVEGIGEDFVPPNADLSLVKKAYSIPDKQSMLAVRDLLSQEGILAGSSSGTLLAAALRYCREQNDGQARRHLRLRQRQQISVEGVRRFLAGRAGPVRAASSMAICATSSPARTARAARCSVGPDDTLLTAYGRMRRGDVSQLPVHRRLASWSASSTRATSSRSSRDRMTAAGTASTRRSHAP